MTLLAFVGHPGLGTLGMWTVGPQGWPWRPHTGQHSFGGPWWEYWGQAISTVGMQGSSGQPSLFPETFDRPSLCHLSDAMGLEALPAHTCLLPLSFKTLTPPHTRPHQ